MRSILYRSCTVAQISSLLFQSKAGYLPIQAISIDTNKALSCKLGTLPQSLCPHEQLLFLHIIRSSPVNW